MNHSLVATSSSPPRSVNTAFSGHSDSGKRQARLKESQFIYKYGQKLHSFEPEKVPYPMSYSKDVLELEHLDVRFVKYLREGSVSFFDFPEEERPERCLDIGCGTGSWVIEAAKEWPKCDFIGLDLVNVQIPLNILDSSVRERIQWIHGNLYVIFLVHESVQASVPHFPTAFIALIPAASLTSRLHFEDDSFDHIHISSIATSVPENKWGVLFDELSRVLRPGGSIEMVEDDILFPVLPRWFTAPMRVRPRRAASVHLPEGSLHEIGGLSSHSDATPPMPSHDHALLESLHKSVFEHRFVNMKPSAVLPSYFTTYFRHVTLGPVLSFPMPPLPPLRPLPPQITTAYMGSLGLDLDQRASVTSSLPTARPISLSFSSAISKETSTTTSDSSQESREKSNSFSLEVSNALASVVAPAMGVDDKSQHSKSRDSFPDLPLHPPSELYMLEASGLADSTMPVVPSVSHGQLESLSERSLAMHLFRSYSYVLGCQEALWEELKDRIRNRKHELEPFGWEDEEEFEEVQNRKKFEKLLERYRSDMQSRVSLWCSLQDIGWTQPVREPLTKAELIEEERMRGEMLEARHNATFEDQQQPCRSVRVLAGFKP